MDLIKKKFDKKKKKSMEKRKTSRASAKTPKNGKSKKPKNKQKVDKKKKASRQSSSSSESAESPPDSERLKVDEDADVVNKRYRMLGALMKRPENPTNYPREILKAEWREMNIDTNVTMDQLKTLDGYLKSRAELKPMENIVVKEGDEDTHDLTIVKTMTVLTKFDEGRFAAIYLVHDGTIVSEDEGKKRFMMKTALRLMSTHQITYRLLRELNVLKSLWSKSNEPPPRIPPVKYEGRILGVPFYITQIYDINLEKCREEMGGGTFSLYSAFHIGQEIFMAIKFLHSRQIIHRDIKPTNVVLSLYNREQWFLIDFGEAIPNGRNSLLSPPDGHTLTFLSREAHDLLNNPGPSTYQQDLESWWLMMVDMYKPLYWRGCNQVGLVQKEKRAYFSRLPSDIPFQLLEIAKLLESDPSPYTEISRKMEEGLGNSKENGWVNEWVDRKATRRNAMRKRLAKKASMMQEVTTTTTVESDEVVKTTDKTDKIDKTKKDQSVYCSVMNPPPQKSPVPPRLTKKPSREANPRPEPQAPTNNKNASFMDDSAVQTPVQTPTHTPKNDPSVYFTDFPVAATTTQVNDGKRKYRYRGK